MRLYAGGCSGELRATVGAGELDIGVEVTVDDDSTTVFRATATTDAENTSGCSEPLTFVEDSTAPETALDSGPPSPTNTATAAFEFSGADIGGSGVASFECRIDSTSPAAWSPCASGIELTGLSEGAHKFEVRALDQAGNADQSPATHEWQIDLTAPRPSIDSLSKALLKAGESSQIQWHGDENGAFELRVGGADCETGPVADSGAYDTQPAARISNVSAAQLVEGTNTLRLCVTDAAGNRGSATTAIVKDSIAPDTAIDAKPVPLTSETDAAFEFSGTDTGGSGVASFECRVDSTAPGAWAPCGSPTPLDDLSDGQHSFEVRAIDQAGNLDPTPASHTWTVDTTPPAVQVTSGPDGLTNDASPTFGFNAEAGAAVVCSIDEGTPDFGPCSGAGSHGSAEPLADGAHTFRVRATDAAGNQAVATRGFDLDATEPDTAVDFGPPLLTDSADAAFEFSGADPGGSGVASFECRIDSSAPGAWSSCASGIELNGLGEGAHGFEVRAIDEAGNADPTPAIYEWSVDTVAPTTQIDSVPPELTDSADAALAFSGADPGGSGIASFECRVDSTAPGAWAPCGSPTALDDLSDGQHSFEVRAIDQAGNTDGSPAGHTWTVDTTPPAVQVTSGPDGLTNNASPNFGFDAEAGAAVVCSIDEGTADFGPCSGTGSHGSAEPLADGAHTFRVRATDAAGNQAVATRGFEVDTALPPAPVLSATAPGSPANHNSPLVLGEAQA
ncbi:MAG TPA: Ig-like domain-containing protein, partial [Solirubrobacterales bacterium]|nr:Ig-like domain-containing protein [Solirubrobacterales bacterium]